MKRSYVPTTYELLRRMEESLFNPLPMDVQTIFKDQEAGLEKLQQGQDKKKRMVFFDQLEELVERSRFSSYPPALERFLNPGHPREIRIPHDLNLMAFQRNILLVDYMNMYTEFQTELLGPAGRLLSRQEVRTSMEFRQKIQSLRNPEYQAAFLQFLYKQLQGGLSQPSPEDVVIIVTQGMERHGRLSFFQNFFLNNVNIMIIEVPCRDSLHYYAEKSQEQKKCHILFGNNEVDDYFLVYIALLFKRSRARLVEMLQGLYRLDPSDPIIMERVSGYQALLRNQNLVLYSRDEYDWATLQRTSIPRMPAPWRDAFKMGAPPTPRKKTGRRIR